MSERYPKSKFPSDLPDGELVTNFNAEQIERAIRNNELGGEILFLDLVDRKYGWYHMYGILETGAPDPSDKFIVEYAFEGIDDIDCDGEFGSDFENIEDCYKIALEDRVGIDDMWDNYSEPIDRRPFFPTVRQSLERVIGEGGCVLTTESSPWRPSSEEPRKKFCL